MFCAKCGAPLNGASFCASCGTAANATAGVPVQPAPTAYQVPPQYGAPVTPPTNGLAIGAFVVSLVCFPTLGFILGLVALNQIKKSPTPQGGKGLATAAVIIGAVFTVFGVIWWASMAALSSSSYGYY